MLGAFEPGVRYPEKQVNDTLARFNADTARLRRSLVEHGLMARAGGGGDYWRLGVQIQSCTGEAFMIWALTKPV
ncbi:MAG: hypothetical protein AVDCRST_MAG86-1241 [uncultured Truepera sp.]|uniref:DUF2087 domain-containing protein n=1 Tax=uncultured Truepera sp. TaxID=543023 RepID=A0A6J4V4V9_9DEIN|nr:MAG: hypothetical protein AVDCRST_MAG86-1241 [uncultured Truepera sp.]